MELLIFAALLLREPVYPALPKTSDPTERWLVL